MQWLAGGAAAIGLAAGAGAGTLDRAGWQQRVAAPLQVGERHASMPVWPIFRPGPGGPELVAHGFETVDLEPVAGYGGKPVNLMVVVDREGRFLEVRLLSHAEPIFRSERGDAVLAAFAAQYQGLTAQHAVQIGSPRAQRTVNENAATLHGITAGTVTATAIDRSILESAAQVAAARLDDANARPLPTAPRGAADDRYQRTGWNALVEARLLQHIETTHRDIEARFRGGAGAGRDAEGWLRPEGVGLDAWVALAGLPQVGRNVIDAASWHEVRRLREAGTQVLLVIDSGRYPVGAPASSPRGATLRLRQDGREFALRPLALEPSMMMRGQRSGVRGMPVARLLAADPGLDPARPFDIDIAVSRGDVAVPLRTHRYDVPAIASWQPVRETPAWWKNWEQRRVDLTVLGAALAVLAVALIAQRRTAATRQRLAAFRFAWLVFVLGFVGWWAQGQLTIVNLTASIESLVAGRSLEFLLADPLAVVLWAVVGVTLFVWGRGTFCGWLCPFGALQEIVSVVARRLGWVARTLRHGLDARLKRVKYAVLAAIAGAAFVSPTTTAALVEVEPFKTSISLYFQRDWPYVAWAVACVALSVFVYRGYCRYLCPLGALLAVAGRVRLLAWIPRRAECGSPCQTCRHRCGYQAIAPTGRVDYAECFQCLDCVSLHDDDSRCLPLVRARRGKVIPIRAAAT